MSWLWENYRRDGLYSVAWRPAAPSLEVGSDPFAVNPLIRFSTVFSPLAEAGLAHPPELEDALLRFLARLDINCGLDRRELALRRLDIELRDGQWGREIGKTYRELSEDEKLAALNLLFECEKGSNLVLDRALSKFFPGSRAYIVEKSGDILVALPQAETREGSRKLAFILDLFLPLSRRVHLSWLHTPCLLDESEATLDACYLY